ncbi:hypothetical protein J22TS1_44080 [Siminovitchia terrae]|uniref:hypothetical protein n=1 Tax=Siminovitchia terrae TaxID=1914933 RepID=UPI001B1439EC|nr:hypothetical protein [Siminovitchia terrae]GIN93357.1 hypothetical protein J22TS1_44080 [Siminovitchia terrae]
MKWNDETIASEIRNLMNLLDIERMPTSTEMKNNKMSGLVRAIGLTGGLYVWAEKLGLKMKEREPAWPDKRIETEIKKCIEDLQIERMPTASELISIGRNDLHCAISKSIKKYSGWAMDLGLSLKASETNKGNKWEGFVKEKLESKGFLVQRMSANHPYDLLINDCVKVDVKVGKAHTHFGARSHTFRTAKKFATCDVYICVALDEVGKIESYFIMPAALIRVVTLNIGTDSKYNKYKNDWDFIRRFVNQYKKAIS